MSVLLVGPPRERGLAVARKLIAQGDEVRAVVPADDPALRDTGTHLAIGDPADDDLLERAGQYVRTIVLFDAPPDALSAALAAAKRARIERVVVVVGSRGAVPTDVLEREAQSYVVLRVGSGFMKRRPSEEEIAEAVDAADDLAGEIKLVVDLASRTDRVQLGIGTTGS